MSSALKNFSITFAIALTVFALLGFLVLAPALVEVFDLSGMGESSEDPSGAVSDNNSSEDVSVESSEGDVSDTTDPDFDENGKVFTAVVMCVDDGGNPVSIAFIDANGKTGNYIYCSIDPKTKVTNEIGSLVPLEDLFMGLDDEAVLKCITAITGIETQYCLRFDKAALSTISGVIPGASVTLNEVIDFDNPAYKDTVFQPGQVYPEDYHITISNVDGRVLLNSSVYEKTNLEWLLSYNPNADGSEYNLLYQQISKGLLKQFLQNEDATKSSSVIRRVLSVAQGNLTGDDMAEYLETVFAYNDYKLHETTYPVKSNKVADWESAVKNLRNYDGSYEKYE